MTAEQLLPKLRVKMTNRINHTYSNEFLIGELEDAIFKVAQRRFVEPSQLESRYESSVVEIALYNIAMIGGDFEATHSENGISRTFYSEKEILSKIMPKARVF